MQKDRQDLLNRTDEIRYALRSLITGALAGMFDAPTNVSIDAGSPGLILDVSTAGNDDELLQLSMLAGLRAVSQLRASGTRRTLLYADETWRLATTSQTVRFLQHSWKLGRQTGTSCWAMIHRFSDLAAQSDDGTALAKVTRALVADSGTHILFRHGKREDAELTAAELSLPAAAVGVLQKLPIHRALVHCGGRLAVVEARFNDTLAQPRLHQPGDGPRRLTPGIPADRDTPGVRWAAGRSLRLWDPGTSSEHSTKEHADAWEHSHHPSPLDHLAARKRALSRARESAGNAPADAPGGMGTSRGTGREPRARLSAHAPPTAHVPVRRPLHSRPRRRMGRPRRSGARRRRGRGAPRLRRRGPLGEPADPPTLVAPRRRSRDRHLAVGHPARPPGAAATTGAPWCGAG